MKSKEALAKQCNYLFNEFLTNNEKYKTLEHFQSMWIIANYRLKEFLVFKNKIQNSFFYRTKRMKINPVLLSIKAKCGVLFK